MIYELRIYRCVPGRKSALLSRFENETLRIWEKHGIRQAGFWTTLIGKSSQEIIYMPQRFSRSAMLSQASTARREHQQPVADAGRIFCREVSTAQCPETVPADRSPIIIIQKQKIPRATQSKQKKP